MLIIPNFNVIFDPTSFFVMLNLLNLISPTLPPATGI